jgi:putative copper export protein
VAPDIVVIGLRALSFVAIFGATGAAVFLWLFGRHLEASLEPIRNLARSGAIAAMLLSVSYYVLIPARMAGSFGATFDPSLEALLSESNVGPAHAVRLAGLGLLTVSLDEQTRLKIAGSLIGVALALLSFVLTGHTAIHESRWALAPLLLVHLGVAAFWFGALWPLAIVASREPIERTAAVVTRFSVLAVRTVPLILVCGAAMALLFIRSFDELFTGYGAMIMLKTVVFALLIGLAALNRQRFGPAIAAARHAALAGFKRVVKAEWVLLAGVVIVSALMTELLAPENLHATFSSEHDETVEP